MGYYNIATWNIQGKDVGSTINNIIDNSKKINMIKSDDANNTGFEFPSVDVLCLQEAGQDAELAGHTLEEYQGQFYTYNDDNYFIVKGKSHEGYQGTSAIVVRKQSGAIKNVYSCLLSRYHWQCK